MREMRGSLKDRERTPSALFGIFGFPILEYMTA